MKLNIEERNRRAKGYVDDKLILVSQLSDDDFKSLDDYEKLKLILYYL